MNSAYFKELHRYSKNEIANLLKIDLKETKELIDKLRLQSIIKIDNSKNELEYYFDYIGIIVHQDSVIKCYPKYIHDKNIKNIDDCLKTIIKVIKRYGKDETIVEGMNGESEELEFNLLSVMLFILYDFIDNGLYSNQKDIHRINGDGEIDWDKTINETYAIINNGKPLYLDFYTRESIDDEYNYFRQLHMYVITKCSNIIKGAGLDKLFSLPVFEFEVAEERFSDNEVVLNKIENELNVQFITRKQVLLKTIHTFISRRESISFGEGLSLFGTKNFNLIWEHVCKSVLDDQLNKKLENLNINLSNSFLNKKKKTLMELIEKPVWTPNADNTKQHKGKKTLIPDIISIYEKDNKKYFVIFDAKYYNISFDTENLSGNPGIEDVTKQYLYNLAYKEFIEVHNFDIYRNAFLFPSNADNIELLGTVKMSILEGLGLNNILSIKLPAEYIYKMYLDGTKLDIGKELNFLYLKSKE